MEVFARRLWPMLLGMSVPQGSMPFTSVYYVGVERRRHAAYVIKTFLQLKNSVSQAPTSFLPCSETICTLAGNPESDDISRAVCGIVHFHLHGDRNWSAEWRPLCNLRDELAGTSHVPPAVRSSSPA